MSGKEILQKELNEFLENPNVNNLFSVDYFDEDNPDIFHWRILIIAPKNTIYEGGFYELEAKFDNDYPNTEPYIKFLTRIYHCNIGYTDGAICLNVLNNWSEYERKPTMEDVLNDICILFYKQNPDSPMNFGDEYIDNYEEFKRKAKEHVVKYANPNVYNNPEIQNKFDEIQYLF